MLLLPCSDFVASISTDVTRLQDGAGAGGSGSLQQQLYAQLALGEELRKFWEQAMQEVEEHNEVLADFKNQALPLARIKKVWGRQDVLPAGRCRGVGRKRVLTCTRHYRPSGLQEEGLPPALRAQIFTAVCWPCAPQSLPARPTSCVFVRVFGCAPA